GVTWKETVETLKAEKLPELSQSLTNPDLTYPDYYQVPFHAYDAGNLCWLAAFEAEPATYAMALRVWPKESLTWQAAQDRLRSSFHQVLGQYCPPIVQDCLDIGCSVGISTRYLQDYLKARQAQSGIIPHTVGLDLSPYMLSVAQFRDGQEEIDWVHGLAEATPFEPDRFDLITLQFLLHELPNQATRNIFAEIYRILRPGGYLAITDNNPRSTVIQNLPPVLFTLMKSTEPWSDEYYTFDVEAALRQIGFTHCTTQESDPRHRTIIAQKPAI
ncbi:MAG: class I SAM-dependent methyltransferase, partial [Prochlorotrichaceae cyanobacterium]